MEEYLKLKGEIKMAKEREHNQKIQCIDCGKKIREGYRRISSRCKPCQLKFRRQKLNDAIQRNEVTK